MITSTTLQNLDLLGVGVAAAAIMMLGFVVLLNGRRNSTNIAFFIFAALTVLYGVTNYLSYQPQPSLAVTLWLLRFTVFFATLHAFSIFHFFYVFPNAKFSAPRIYKFFLIPAIAFTAIATLSPLVFPGVQQLPGAGQGTRALLGPLVPVFGIVSGAFVLASIILLLRKLWNSHGVERRQYVFVAIGTVLTFSFIIGFVLVLPIVYQDINYIPFVPLFVLPFIIFAAYAIIKYHLFNVKVITTEVMTFFLSAALLLEVVFTKDTILLIMRSSVFLLVFSFGILLIRSVRREVEQRTELELLTGKLKEANTHLEELGRFKTQLLSLASHQIKSPLAAIKGFTSLLIEGLYGPLAPNVQETLLKIKRSTDGLVELINTLLDLRKVEEGKMQYQFAKVDVVPLAGSVMEELQPLAGEKNLEFTFHSSSPSVWVSADPQKLKQVFQNLVDNAIKYTPKGFVHVNVAEQEGAVVFSVADSGLGVPHDLLKGIFEEFIRDERVRKEIMGTGLGLYIARRIVEAHGGRIWAESKGVNQGSTFSAVFKKAA